MLRGLRAEPSRRKKWARKAAEQGIPRAQFQLGFVDKDKMRFEGVGSQEISFVSYVWRY
jgi:TPR repeat protein